jgi:general stress protein YciG
MAGNKLGGVRAAAANKQRYGIDFYKQIGKLGGEKSRGGGFSYYPELAKIAGSAGGKRRWNNGQDAGKPTGITVKSIPPINPSTIRPAEKLGRRQIHMLCILAEGKRQPKEFRVLLGNDDFYVSVPGLYKRGYISVKDGWYEITSDGRKFLRTNSFELKNVAPIEIKAPEIWVDQDVKPKPTAEDIESARENVERSVNSILGRIKRTADKLSGGNFIVFGLTLSLLYAANTLHTYKDVPGAIPFL